MTAPATWRSRPVFITSTFRDMQAERDWLHNHVFPELEERLRERFHHLETIDLRWGVDSAAADEEQREAVVLTVCLREIERSRPFLIGLLGDRYGWQPPAARMTNAAREAGLDSDVSGKSVTELEILYGVLRRRDQQHRSWFYLRDPLPYDAMPPEVAKRYSDLHSGEPGAADSARKLAGLRERLGPALPGRVRRYTATWNAETNSVTGLEAWGRQVLDDLWGDLEAATDAFLQDSPRTWQEQDRWALDEFIEGRLRDFVGRTAITERLVTAVTSSTTDGALHGVCVTAEAGAGKSSLFGHLYRSLQEADVLLLAQAAGISVRSTQVNWMLRRWVGELTKHLGQSDPLPEQASPDEVDKTFSRLLHQAAQQRRVVILIDALNQFEPTTRGTHLTWLTKLWPPNARLIATAIPGAQSEALRKRPGFAEEPLSPLVYEEGLEIVRRICGRYHRTLNEQVQTTLLGKKRADGTPAFGNPLWLQLATEELNLLGSETFERIEESTGAHGIVRLLTSVAEQMPPDVEGLYGWMLDRAERHFGQARTRAFVNVIAVSRAGWRESDFRELMSALSGETWDPLRFATLRRAFRAHVVQRGANAQWDFAHTQMRQAVRSRLEASNETITELHQTIAQHLGRLPADDALHESETMVHLMQTEDRRDAAKYYGGHLTAGEAAGATAALLSLVLQEGAARAVTMLDRATDNAARVRIGERFLFELDAAIKNVVPLKTREELTRSTERTFQTLAAADSGNAGWQHDLFVSHVRLGDVLVAQGNLPGALAAFQASLARAERLAAADPSNAEWQRDLSVSHTKVGDALVAQGNLAGALGTFQASLAIRERLAAADPGNAEWQGDLSASHDRLGLVLVALGNLAGARAAFQASHRIIERLAVADPGNANWQRDLSISHGRLGDVLVSQGNLAGALAAFQADLAIRERLAAADPGNAGWQRDLAVSQVKVGDVLVAQGSLAGALAAFQASRAIAEGLAAADPRNAGWQRDLAVSQVKVGDVLVAQGSLAGALAAFQTTHEIIERLAAADPGNTKWQCDLSISHGKLGNMLVAQGNLAGALAALQASHAIAERLAAADTRNAGWQRDLSVSHDRLGDALMAQGNLSAALAAFQASLAVRERLVASDAGNAAWQSDLSVSHDRLGDVLVTQGNLAGALAAFQAGLTIREGLAAADPRNAGWQRALAVSHIKIGDVLVVQGSLAAALAAFHASHAIAERLVAADPRNAEWQRDLSVSHDRLGEVLVGEGNLATALGAFQASLAIRERLAAADPGNAGWQRDLVVSYSRLATYAAGTSEATAAEYWALCLRTLRQMKAKNMFLDPPLVRLLEQLERTI